MVDEAYPDAEIIRQVQDNLNTYLPGSLYHTFEPAEARRLLRKLESERWREQKETTAPTALIKNIDPYAIIGR